MENNTTISVTLDAQQWNIVVGQLMEGTYKVMAPLIGLIVSQCSQSPTLQPAPPTPEGQMGPRLVVADGPPPGYVKPQPNGSAGDGDNSETAPSAAE